MAITDKNYSNLYGPENSTEWNAIKYTRIHRCLQHDRTVQWKFDSPTTVNRHLETDMFQHQIDEHQINNHSENMTCWQTLYKHSLLSNKLHPWAVVKQHSRNKGGRAKSPKDYFKPPQGLKCQENADHGTALHTVMHMHTQQHTVCTKSWRFKTRLNGI